MGNDRDNLTRRWKLRQVAEVALPNEFVMTTLRPRNSADPGKDKGLEPP
jgi:hypothetical protein